MIFDGGVIGAIFSAPIVVDFAGSDKIEIIGQLRIENGARVLLSGPTTSNTGRQLTIGGTTASANGDDFFVAAGSELDINFSGNTDNRFLALRIATGHKGRVAGIINFQTNAAITTRIVAADINSLVFVGSAQFIATSLSGSPFGTTNLLSTLTPGIDDVTVTNSVVFKTGTTYRQIGGVHPFSEGPSPVAVFESGSTYLYNNGTFDTKGETYGNLEFDITGTGGVTVGGTQPMVVANNLTMTLGAANLSEMVPPATGSGLSIGGNLLVKGGTLNFAPTQPSKVTFNGTTAQTISGAGGLSFNANASLEINNSAGLTLNRPVTLTGGTVAFTNGLVLTNGLITTTATNLLTLPYTARITGGASSNNNGVGGSFVNGPVAFTTTGSVTGLVFPVGKIGAFSTIAPTGLKIYRPMGLTTINQTSAITYEGEQIEARPTQNATAGVTNVDIDHVSFVRYFTLKPSPAQPTDPNFNAVVSLSFGDDDFVTDPNLTSFVIAKRNAPGNWTSAGHGPVTASTPAMAATLSSMSPPFISSFSEFALGSLRPVNPGGVNPLPVELTRFVAALIPSGVALNWATATEKNNDRFEVQRSADGQSFQTIGTVKGQGNSSNLREYAFTDSRPITGQSYYRLRQVDIDGSSAFSSVVAVQTRTETAVYPNPATNVVVLPATLGPVRYRVLNAVGQTLLSGNATGNDRLDLTTLNKGVFFLEMTGAAGRTTQRLVRE